MSLKLEVRPEESYLYARALGKRTVNNISSVARQTVDACVKNNLDAVLLDAREFDGRISIFDAFLIPTRLFPSLKKMGILKRVAILDIKERSERLAFFESVSQKRGYNIRAFTQLEPAIKWLTNGPEAESEA